VWDLRYATPLALDFGNDGSEANTVSFGIIAPAVIGETSKQQPIGSLVLPGTYTVRLTAGGRVMTRTLTVTNDPRSDATMADLTALHAQERRLMTGLDTTRAAIEAIRTLQQNMQTAARAHADLAPAVNTLSRAAGAAIAALAGARGLADKLADLQFADLKPTPSTVASIDALCKRADDGLARARDFVSKDLASISASVAAAGVPAPTPAVMPASACGPGR
jgi:hypothetical protein